jgi:hypothetical protein
MPNGTFRCFIKDDALKEIHLNGRLFTWSKTLERNERSHLTLECIDQVFISIEWDALFPDHNLQSLSSLCLDHAPLLLRTKDDMQAKKRFHFRSFWPRFPGF